MKCHALHDHLSFFSIRKYLLNCSVWPGQSVDNHNTTFQAFTQVRLYWPHQAGHAEGENYRIVQTRLARGQEVNEGEGAIGQVQFGFTCTRA